MRASLLPIIYFMGNRILLSCFIVRMAAKSPFCLPSILLPEAMDQSGTPLRLMLRPPSFYQGPICQVWSSGLDGTWQQPKGVELGISKITNYNRELDLYRKSTSGQSLMASLAFRAYFLFKYSFRLPRILSGAEGEAWAERESRLHNWPVYFTY